MMERIIKFFLLLISSLIFTNCKKDIESKTKKKPEKLILDKIGSFDIKTWSVRTGKLDYEHMDYENDSIYYSYGMLHGEYEVPEISEEGILYIKGNEFIVNITPKTKDSIVKLYNLNKIQFEWKKKFQKHFEYEDCILKQKVKRDSGAVLTLQTKKGALFQIIDIRNKQTFLQVCHKGKTYKERIPSGIDNIYGKLLGKGSPNAMLYDINKDGEDELLIIIDGGGTVGMSLLADIYKINLPE